MLALHKKAGRLHRDERGFTLIEMFASLLILGMLASILYAFMLMGMTMYKRVSSETQLRNQANAVFGGIVEELRGAVYADAAGPDGKSITLVKSLDKEKYVEEYQAKFTPDPANPDSQIFVTNSGDGTNKVLKMSGERFKMNGFFTMVDGRHDSVDVTLQFKGSPSEKMASGDHFSQLEDSALEIKRTIPLFRIE